MTETGTIANEQDSARWRETVARLEEERGRLSSRISEIEREVAGRIVRSVAAGETPDVAALEGEAAMLQQKVRHLDMAIQEARRWLTEAEAREAAEAERRRRQDFLARVRALAKPAARVDRAALALLAAIHELRSAVRDVAGEARGPEREAFGNVPGWIAGFAEHLHSQIMMERHERLDRALAERFATLPRVVMERAGWTEES